ncbi:MAG: DUF5615 family PIN-like protein [Pyrinomonadaceae bacterium MAG19_C2-C3]|nr:DUF5615 family PIN-like protein [Pyrinomonadaceae bacterium MAG19_C2-C3]
MKIRFQADADFNEDIVTGVRRRVPQIDFQTAHDAMLRGITDPDVLSLAAREGRILLTHDRRTMPNHFGKFIEKQDSPGLLVVSQKADVLVVIEDVILIWTASEATEYVNSIRSLPL